MLVWFLPLFLIFLLIGLPVFFAAKLILEGKTTLKGIKIPVYEELYSPKVI